MRRLVLAVLVAALALCGCGPKAINKGTRPFPSEKGIFTDASGNVLSDLPGAAEPFRLIFLDFPWCPVCRDAWKSILEAAEAAPPGSLRVYRILFDRETLITTSGKKESPPMRPTPPPWPGFTEDGGNVKVTTLTALPAAFQEEFRVRQGPLLLLLDREGTVQRRWNGYSTSLKEELTSELRKTAPLP